MSLTLPVHPAIVIACSTWFFLNVYLWTIPSWRRNAVSRRGPLLGLGFAFAAAFVSALADGAALGVGRGAALFAWRFFLLSLPFIPPLARRLSPYPHRWDAAAAVFAVLLPHAPGFNAVWFRLSFESGGAWLTWSAQIGPGHLCAAALLTTYFYGVRPWTAAPLDWTLRPGDGRAAVLGAASALVGSALFARLFFALGLQEAPTIATLAAPENLFAWLGAGIAIACFLEELLFRGLLLPAWRYGPLSRVAKGMTFGVVSVVLTALAHAATGSFGLSRGAAFGLSLGIGAWNVRRPRLLPAMIGHALALAIMGVAAVL